MVDATEFQPRYESDIAFLDAVSFEDIALVVDGFRGSVYNRRDVVGVEVKTSDFVGTMETCNNVAQAMFNSRIWNVDAEDAKRFIDVLCRNWSVDGAELSGGTKQVKLVREYKTFIISVVLFLTAVLLQSGGKKIPVSEDVSNFRSSDMVLDESMIEVMSEHGIEAMYSYLVEIFRIGVHGTDADASKSDAEVEELLGYLDELVDCMTTFKVLKGHDRLLANDGKPEVFLLRVQYDDGGVGISQDIVDMEGVVLRVLGVSEVRYYRGCKKWSILKGDVVDVELVRKYLYILYFSLVGVYLFYFIHEKPDVFHRVTGVVLGNKLVGVKFPEESFKVIGYSLGVGTAVSTTDYALSMFKDATLFEEYVRFCRHGATDRKLMVDILNDTVFFKRREGSV